MKTDPLHTSNHHKPSDEEEVKVTLTFNSLDELLEHLNITVKATNTESNPTKEEDKPSSGCGCYIASFIAIVIAGFIFTIIFAKILLL